MNNLIEIGKRAKEAAGILAKAGQKEKNEALELVAAEIKEACDEIIAANEIDLKNADENNMAKSLKDRLSLNKDRIDGIVDAILQVRDLPDPIGEVTRMWERPNGLRIGHKRVPIGVVGMIYESRPNVTADAFAISLKTGNACILRGGSDALHSNLKLTEVIRRALSKSKLPVDAVQSIESADRSLVTEMLNLRDYIDLIIPRGSRRLIDHVVENASVPVIETGTGNCHVYVDESADLQMAVNIIENAKTQRTGVCNACESVLIHKAVVEKFVPMLVERLKKHNVEMRGDDKVLSLSDAVVEATEDDWGTEYLDYIISIKTVADLDEAIAHINKYNTGHSESIVTKDYENAERFLNEVDAACVYVNASTRFTDGTEFGFGAEIGISTQKLHARGPMGPEQLTSEKYIIYGNGQVRP